MSENPQSAPAQRYTAQLAGQIETKWQDRWEELGTFYADNPPVPWPARWRPAPLTSSSTCSPTLG